MRLRRPLALGLIFALLGLAAGITPDPKSVPTAVHEVLIHNSPPPAASLSTRPATELSLDLGGKAPLKLVLIPAGKFLLGSPDTEKGRNTAEVQHEVTITKPFYMGITHVTVDQFAAFVKDAAYLTDAERDGWSTGIKITNDVYDRIPGCSWRNPSFAQKGNHPVVEVSWNDAAEFCAWLSKKSGKTVVLPTEAQWEYACRAGTTTAYPWGDNPDDGKGWANLADQSYKKQFPDKATRGEEFSWDDGFAFTSPVASFKPNRFGLYDMIGNAWQWCHDRYDFPAAPATQPAPPGPQTDPAGPPAGRFRLLRGGSWYGYPKYCRSAYRSIRWDPTHRDAYTGFRVAVASTDD